MMTYHSNEDYEFAYKNAVKFFKDMWVERETYNARIRVGESELKAIKMSKMEKQILELNLEKNREILAYIDKTIKDVAKSILTFLSNYTHDNHLAVYILDKIMKHKPKTIAKILNLDEQAVLQILKENKQVV